MSESLATLPSAAASPVRAHQFRRVLKRGWLHCTVGLLLVLYVVVAVWATSHKAQAYDEGEQIAVGYDMWLRRDFRMETANGDLVKRWATLPLLVTRPRMPATTDRAWREGMAYRFAFQFMFQEGNDPRTILLCCRTMVALIGAATGLLIFVLSRELFGDVGGLISLIVFVASPTMLAFGGIVSTEMTTCLFLLGSVWATWRLLQRVTWRNLCLSVAFCSLLVLSKPTAVIMFPLSAIAVAIRLATKRPLEWEIGVHRAIRSRIRQLSIIAALVVVHIAFGWAALWAAYDFRYAASPAPADPAVRVYTPVQDPIDPNVMAFIRWSHRHHFLPEGFLRGVELLLGQNETQLAFMNGHWRFGGWPTFFPYTILVKTQPSKLIAFIVAAVAWVLLIRRKNVPPGWPDFAASERIYRAVPFVSLIVVYFAIALTWQMNIGFRHILPLYPAAFVLCGALSYFWNGQPWRSRAAVGTLVLSSVVSPIAVFPHYLAYFSPLAGGPKEGYKHLVDSSLDWGMDLPGLKAWVDRHNPGGELPVFLAYFGVSSPDYYHLKCFRLPSRPEWRDGRSFPLGPGIYAISATLLQGVGTRAPGPWNQVYERAWWRSLAAINHYDETLKDPAAHAALLAKIPQSAWDAEYTRFEQLRFARLCAWLRHHRPPDDNIGYSILIWRLTKEEVFAAGLGPPAELELAPIHP